MQPALEPAPRPSMVNWRRNLAALWVAELTAILGFSFAFPFLPLFPHRELHIPNGPQLAFWSGISAGVTGFALALTSPIWGRLADRYGRKPMLVRAMIGGVVSVGLMGLTQSARQLTALRAVQGASSGTVAAATALVATETPGEHLAWALGILSSAISFGNAVGPAGGGLAANFVMRNHPRRSVGMRTAATAKCIIGSATLVVVVVPAETGTLSETSKTAMAMPVQMARARAKRLSRMASKPHPARDAAKLLKTTEAMPTL